MVFGLELESCGEDMFKMGCDRKASEEGFDFGHRLSPILTPATLLDSLVVEIVLRVLHLRAKLRHEHLKRSKMFFIIFIQSE